MNASTVKTEESPQSVEIVWPVAVSNVDKATTVAAVGSDRGTSDVVAFIDNTKPHLKDLYDILCERLIQPLGLREIRLIQKPSMAQPLTEEQVVGLDDVRFAIYAMDD